MPSTASNTLLRTMTVAQNICRNAPLSGVGGNPIEPAASIGDWVRNFILSPPFAWRWNRVTTAVSVTAAAGQDYSVAISNFGWLESATLNDGTGSSTSITSLEIKLNLPEDNAPSLPRFLSARLDDDAGNITFRLHPKPDANYTLTLSYQKASPTFVTLNDTWSPLPDYMSHTYSMGFLARAYEYFDDPRFIPTFQMFLRQLLSFNEGLSESQKNIFLSDFLDSFRQQSGTGINVQLAKQARSGL